MTMTAIPDTGELLQVPLELLIENPANVRTSMNGASINELATSIASEGLLQSLRVQALSDGTYMVIAGNRRLRALKKLAEAGQALEYVPCILVGPAAKDEDVLVQGLIENLQREDLDPIDEAAAYARLLEMGFKNKDLSARIGRSASHISKRFALLTLPLSLQKVVSAGKLPLAMAYDLTTLPVDKLDQIFGTDEDGQLQVDDDAIEQAIDQIPWEVQNHARQEEAAKAKGKLARTLRGLGYTVVEHLDPGFRFLNTWPPTATPEVEDGDIIMVDWRGDGFRQYRKAPDYVAPEVDIPADASEAETAELVRLAAYEAKVAREKEETAANRAKLKEAKATAIANAKGLLVKPKKADVLELAFDMLLHHELAMANSAIKAMVVKILDVEPERVPAHQGLRTNPKPDEVGKTRPDYAATITTYLTENDFKAKAEVFLALEAAHSIEGYRRDELFLGYAKNRDLPLQ